MASVSRLKELKDQKNVRLVIRDGGMFDGREATLVGPGLGEKSFLLEVDEYIGTSKVWANAEARVEVLP